MASNYGKQVTTAILAYFPTRGQLDAGKASYPSPFLLRMAGSSRVWSGDWSG